MATSPPTTRQERFDRAVAEAQREVTDLEKKLLTSVAAFNKDVLKNNPVPPADEALDQAEMIADAQEDTAAALRPKCRAFVRDVNRFVSVSTYM